MSSSGGLSDGVSQPASRAPVSGRSALIGLAVVVTAMLLFCFPFVHAVYWLGDEGILLRGAAALAAGGKIYTDFFAFYPPVGLPAWKRSILDVVFGWRCRMPRKIYKPEEIIAKLCQVEILTAQGKSAVDAIWSIGVTDATYCLYGRLSRCK